MLGSDTALAVESPPVAEPAQPKQSTAKVIRAAVVGTVVEYYDFGIYGYMATMVATLFFVSEDETAALLGTFAAFAVAFFLRVPGGIFFGHIGDKYGRKTALSWTILLMVVATAAMGLMPTYATLGVWATALLVLARCLQGFAAGGELSGANAFVSESAPARWRATQTSLVNSGTYLGSLVASLVALGITSVFTEEQILEWAWRVPFLLSVVIGVVGVWIRNHLEDTPQFEELADKGETKKLPFVELLKTSGGSVVKIVMLGALIVGGYYIASVYAATYLQTEGGQTKSVSFLSTSLALVLGVITLPIAGYMADKFGRKPVLFAGSVASAVLGVPMFMLMAGGTIWQAVLGQSVLFICVSVVNGASFVVYVEMLKASVRYSGIALGNNITNMCLGGTAPFIATYLIDLTGNSLAPAGYFVFCALLTLIAVFTIKETKGIELRTD
ncbi:MFS transporter [Rhodococcus coprophilus]|uniref:Putative proline/betaine transporter n=1 Tax=Rhodococcus coprophilus TaxID=38310 RepID=A0A2X4X5G0_9NOCA|nr:MFS transporter [Rhodococcus coprophilus]MBM7459134.1 MHS family proline/betaine transporter-like MFS transporter [Rhodococcus coprophilus]SQI34755.1 mfs transporter [Rhodococcus coprophilus]